MVLLEERRASKLDGGHRSGKATQFAWWLPRVQVTRVNKTFWDPSWSIVGGSFSLLPSWLREDKESGILFSQRILLFFIVCRLELIIWASRQLLAVHIKHENEFNLARHDDKLFARLFHHKTWHKAGVEETFKRQLLMNFQAGETSAVKVSLQPCRC